MICVIAVDNKVLLLGEVEWTVECDKGGAVEEEERDLVGMGAGGKVAEQYLRDRLME